MNFVIGNETFRFNVDITPATQRAVEAMLLKIDKAIARSFAEYIASATSPESVRTLALLIADGRIDDAASFVAAQAERIGQRIADAVRASGEFEVEAQRQAAAREQAAEGGLGSIIPPIVAGIIGDFPQPSVSVSFNPGNPRAAELMRTTKDNFLVAFKDDQRRMVREIIVDALARGAGPRETALQVRPLIGLSAPQARALVRYRQSLEALDPYALTSVSRDRRMDSTVRRAIESGAPLPADRIDALIDARRRKMLRMRSETIAINESATALNRGREEGLRQLIERTGIDPSTVKREWRSLRDRRVRDTHQALDGQKTGLDGVFMSPSGAMLRYPHDPLAPAAETINCRCYLIHKIGR